MTIRKNTHSPLRMPRLLLGQDTVMCRAALTDSCRYTLPPEDQPDINKLFGIGYLNCLPIKSGKPVPPHRCNSVRVGWSYDPATDSFPLSAYWYSEGKRHSHHMCSAVAGESFQVEIKRKGREHLISIWTGLPSGPSRMSVEVRPSWLAYMLRPYFGGNRKAPHDMEIRIDVL